jgi:mannose-6-phosphate isomerase-like protein (cupin superfamily)
MSEQNIVAQKISKANADSYKWGGPKADQCDGWHLVRTPQLSIIEESMPPGTSEHRHHHLYARQFFYVLQGNLAIEIEGTHIDLGTGEGIEIAPGQAHQVLNNSSAIVRFLVVSNPPSHGDRVNG